MNTNFQTLQEEISAFEEMSEAEVIDFYNVDYKEEARRLIEDWWSMIN